MHCRICGKESKNERVCNRCDYFLGKGVDENTIKTMLSDDKSKAIWKRNEKLSEELGRVYYKHVIENYNQSQIKKDSKENFGFNTFIEGIRLGLDTIIPLLDEETKQEVDEKLRSMIAFRKSADSKGRKYENSKLKK